MSEKLASVDIKYSYIFGVTLSGNYIRNGVSISSFNSKYMFSHYSNHLKSIPDSTISYWKDCTQSERKIENN